jgi:hypothetical protein
VAEGAAATAEFSPDTADAIGDGSLACADAGGSAVLGAAARGSAPSPVVRLVLGAAVRGASTGAVRAGSTRDGVDDSCLTKSERTPTAATSAAATPITPSTRPILRLRGGTEKSSMLDISARPTLGAIGSATTCSAGRTSGTTSSAGLVGGEDVRPSGVVVADGATWTGGGGARPTMVRCGTASGRGGA